MSSGYIEITKAKLCRMYGISDTTLATLLNKVHFEELKELGYTNKYCKRLSPKVVRRFIEIYDPPLKKEDFE